MTHAALNILIVDDEESIRTLLQMELEDRGFNVISCATVADATRIMNSTAAVDIALLDLRLGDGSGMDILKMLHDRNSQTPVIMMTGHGNKNVILEALKLGVFDYLEKPFSVKDDLFPVLWRAQSVAMLAKENASLYSELRHNAKLAALGEVSAMVMHDVRGPLSAIQLCCEDMLEEGMQNGTISLTVLKDHIGQIERSCSRIKKMGDHLRSFSRDDSQEAERFVGVDEIINSALYFVQRKIRDYKINIIKEIPERLVGSEILCPQNGLEQSIMNLLSNACDAMSTTEKRTLGITVDTNTESFLLTISDTGVGMSPAVLEKISHAFFTTKQANEGTGLGVKIARDTVEKMSGALSVTSREGVGTAFVIKIPVVRLKTLDRSDSTSSAPITGAA